MPAADAVIFDLDGTLLDTESLSDGPLFTPCVASLGCRVLTDTGSPNRGHDPCPRGRWLPRRRCDRPRHVSAPAAMATQAADPRASRFRVVANSDCVGSARVAWRINDA